MPIGVLRAVEAPTYDSVVRAQEDEARSRAPSFDDIEALWTHRGETWDVT